MKYLFIAIALSALGACSSVAPKVGQNCISTAYQVKGVSNAETETRDAQCTAAQLAVPG